MSDAEVIWPAVDLGDCKSHGILREQYNCGFIVYGRKPKRSAQRRSEYALRLFVLLHKRKPKRSRIRKKMQKASRLCWVNLTL